MTIETLEGRRIHESSEIPGVTMKILCLTGLFPGFADYQAGGAERVLQRLVTSLHEVYPSDYQISIFVSRNRMPNTQSPVPEGIEISGSSSKIKLLGQLFNRQKNHDLLFCPEGIQIPSKKLAAIEAFWWKPIVTRIASELNLDAYQGLSQFEQRVLFAKINKIIAISPKIKLGLENANIDPERIAFIPNGIDTAKFRPVEIREKSELRQRLFNGEISDEKIIFIYNGRIFEKTKRIKTLLDIWKNSNLADQGHALALIGPIIEKNSDILLTIKNYLEQGDENIFWFGSMSPEEGIKYLQASDFFIFPSDFEGMSNALIEAMSCGLIPIVRKGVSGNGALVQDGFTGFVFEGDEDLGSLMMSLTQNKNGFEEISGNARQLIVNDYSLSKMTQSYDHLFRSVLQRQ